MNTRAIESLRRRLGSDEPAYGIWITLESPSIAEIAAALGLDYIVIDAEHGHLDWRDIANHLRGVVRSETVALVRLAELNGGLIKRALDLGADGIVIPWIESASQAEKMVAFARYPPSGVRGMGAERATGWGRALAQHAREANDHVLCVPIIETVAGGRRIDEIASVPGIEILQLGPADYSSSAGYGGQWEGPGVAEEILRIKDAIRGHGKHAGIAATSDDDLEHRREQGFRLLSVGMDAGLLLRSLSASLKRIGRDAVLTPTLTPPPRNQESK